MTSHIIETLVGLDRQLLFLINHTRHPILDVGMVFLSRPPGWFWGLLGIFCLWRLAVGCRKERIAICATLLAVGLSDLLSFRVLKPLFMRPRPFDVLEGIWLYKGGGWSVTTAELVARVSGTMSFPSTHAMNSWSAAACLLTFAHGCRTVGREREDGAGGLGIAAWCMALVASAVAYSRVYLGVHYPFDVLAGAVLGGLLGGIVAVTVCWIMVIRRSKSSPSGQGPRHQRT